MATAQIAHRIPNPISRRVVSKSLMLNIPTSRLAQGACWNNSCLRGTFDDRVVDLTPFIRIRRPLRECRGAHYNATHVHCMHAERSAAAPISRVAQADSNAPFDVELQKYTASVFGSEHFEIHSKAEILAPSRGRIDLRIREYTINCRPGEGHCGATAKTGEGDNNKNDNATTLNAPLRFKNKKPKIIIQVVQEKNKNPQPKASFEFLSSTQRFFVFDFNVTNCPKGK